MQGVGEMAIFFWCAASVGLIRFGVGRMMRVERESPGGWRDVIDGPAVLRPRRLNLWLGVTCLAIAMLFTTLWLVQR